MISNAPIRWRLLGRIAALAIAAGIVAATVAGLVAFAVSQSLPNEYDAQAGLIVGSLTATSTNKLDTYQRLATTYAELATSSPILSRVIDRLGLIDKPGDLATKMNVRASGRGIVLIDATSTDPIKAAQIANTIADEILRLAVPVVIASPAPSPRATAGTSASLASIFQPALPPSSPSAPRVFLNALIAGLLGFALGAGFAVFIATRRRVPGSAGP